MASRVLTRTDRRERLGVGQQIDGRQGSAKWYATTRSAEGRLVVCLDYGDHRTRVEWSSLVKEALSRRRPPAADAFHEHPAPMLAELPEEKRAAITKRYRDLLHIKYGSPRGDADGDRRAGMLNPDRRCVAAAFEAAATHGSEGKDRCATAPFTLSTS